MHESYKALIPLILPESIEEYFELTEVEKKDAAIHIYLKEVNKTPEEHAANKLHSKGFFEPITLQDFPIRGFQVYLHITRRRWMNEDTGKVVYRNWDLVAQGTRITKGFAAFLKAFSRYTGA
ncbi:transposase [Solitalea lacus]|uniref:ISAon1 family transposase N-terminal region protein n=1 Tax=Solitalea lacus TaxID=2911172 RepID=UPI001EDA1026|nr:transposase [Solitalea lacus]UKJ06558.1 transposase [Solitalea lacus]